MTARILLYLLAALTIGGGAISQLGRWLEAPADTPSNADVIVVLGGGSASRVSTGLNLYMHGMAPRVLLSGAEPSVSTAANARIDWRAERLTRAGVPGQFIFFDTQSRNTWEEAVNALRLMQDAGWRKAIVVSDPAHMRRLSWAWARAARPTNMSYVLVSAPPERWKSDDWWGDDFSRQYVLREVPKLLYYYIAH